MTKSNKIMKRYIKTSLFAMTAVLALLSCSNDILLRESGKPASGTDAGPRVTFTVGEGKATTRTAVVTNYAGFAREKAIDVAHSYAVVFRPDGTHYGTFALSYDETDPENPYYHFTLGNGGYYYMYVVANTSLTLTSETITDAASLFSLIDTTDPGADKQASTNFLMISPKTLVDVDGNQDTSLGAVTLTRAAVRYDIDATAIDGFQITSVQISNRYTTSMLARGSGNATTMTGLTKAASAETYTRGTESGQVPASGDYVEGTSTYYVDNQQWLGVIYGCENYSEDNADITEITINGTLLGVQVSHTVSFKDASTAVVTKPKRNTVYTVTLQAEGSGLGKGAISSNILVKDWDGTETITYGDLNDISKPNFQITSEQEGDDYPLDGDEETKTNPQTIITDGEAGTVVTLNAMGKNIAPRLRCIGLYDASEDELVAATGVTLSKSSVTNDGAGNVKQTWTITIANAIEDDDYLSFSLENEYDLTNAKREFRVTGWKDAHIGDYYYSDGTWSTERDGSKTVIGLVFCTTPTSDDIARGYKHGYVIALKDYADSNDTKWAEANGDVNEIMTDYSITQANQFGGLSSGTTLAAPATIDLNGLTNTLKIAAKASGKTYSASKFSDLTSSEAKLSDLTNTTYHAAYKAVHYTDGQAAYVAPAKSSGWYLPSIGQQYLWLWHFGYQYNGGTSNTRKVPDTFRANEKDCYWTNGAQNAGKALNYYFSSKLSSGEYTAWDESKAGKYYWSSTVRSASGYPFGLSFGTNGPLYLGGYNVATTAYRVRPVLAF